MIALSKTDSLKPFSEATGRRVAVSSQLKRNEMNSLDVAFKNFFLKTKKKRASRNLQTDYPFCFDSYLLSSLSLCLLFYISIIP